MKPVLVVGAGPVGLMTALALKFYNVEFRSFEEDSSYSSDTKAGTILTRTLEAFRRYGMDEAVLADALRVDEIGDIERATNMRRKSVQLDKLVDDTRFPFVLNIPQHHLEPILARGLDNLPEGWVNLRHKLLDFREVEDGVVARFETPEGIIEVEGSYLIACDGGRSTIRAQLGVEVEGISLDVRYMLVDIKVDLDKDNPRDYPYLAYFADPQEWMILVRQPHCWRFLFPLAPGAEEASREELEAKARHFIGEVSSLEVLNTVIYRVHHRIATKWRTNRVFLAGDAAHLITPMWALGLNTGVLDAINLPWRLAWVLRGWADDSLLDGYEREQRPLAAHGSGEMAEAARKLMGTGGGANALATTPGAEDDADWATAMTRTLLSARVDPEGAGDWSIVKSGRHALRIGDRIADMPIFDGAGRRLHVHDLCDDSFVALYFTDARRRPVLPPDDLPGLKSYVVSRWDAPMDSGLRDRALFDSGNRLRTKLGIGEDMVVLVRPDDHVAAILPMNGADISTIYKKILGRA
ncbi:FAD-dependent monooxygenase [Devosia faecipullorum]|uniref:FAD-dependent monooxygenase n=1 Tax=Devosia faecipullorum TaxID=2755039 RepID=UPI00187B4DC8|nr:FAD-dependent monooxygenase [Devosia faecipullorum]MBE7732904.1 FAD-dependent monooxygenase [Devosia faecipullorum]